MNEADLIWKAAKSLDADCQFRSGSVEGHFEELALRLFRYQAVHVPAYSEFIRLLRVDPDSVDAISSIPFLPVEFFKSHKVHDSISAPILRFESSGTTGTTPSIHFVSDPHYLRGKFYSFVQVFLW